MSPCRTVIDTPPVKELFRTPQNVLLHPIPRDLHLTFRGGNLGYTFKASREKYYRLMLSQLIFLLYLKRACIDVPLIH